MTARQWLVWREWMKNDWNDPNRSDWYVMELTAAVKRIFADKPMNVTTESQKQTFTWKTVDADGTIHTEEPQQSSTTKQTEDERNEERDRRNKQYLLGMLGVRLDEDGNQIA